MNLSEAINQACGQVGIIPPKGAYRPGQWAKCDTLAGKSGKGDGRVIVDDMRVTAHNWQTGENVTVWLKGESEITPKDRRIIARQIEQEKDQKRAREERAAKVAVRMVEAAQTTTHPYFARKGFPAEKALVLDAATIRKLGGDYLIAGERAIVMPARIGAKITSVQLIWEDGSKRFLAGGSVTGSCHRIAKGSGPKWHCEGYATGLTLRTALKGLNRSDTILCCFSAGNVASVARNAKGRAFIVTDNDKPMPQFDGLGTGEHWARTTGLPYMMPPEVGTDLNDFHQEQGIFAVQRILTDFLRCAK